MYKIMTTELAAYAAQIVRQRGITEFTPDTLGDVLKLALKKMDEAACKFMDSSNVQRQHVNLWTAATCSGRFQRRFMMTSEDKNKQLAEALCALWGWIKAEADHFDGNMPDDFIVELVINALHRNPLTHKQAADT